MGRQICKAAGPNEEACPQKKEKQEENRMEIRKTQEGSTLTIALVGRLDTTTAPGWRRS